MADLNPKIMSGPTVLGGKCGCDNCKRQSADPTPPKKKGKK